MHIKKVFNMVCLDRVFEVYEDEKWAVKSFEEEKEMLKIQQQKLRRRFRRLALDVEMEIKSKHEDTYHRAKLFNLSAVGMLVFADKTYPLGEKVDVRLSLKPVVEKVDVTARVSWLVDKKIQPQIYPGMGLEFYHLEAKTQEKIIEYVERNLPLDCGSHDLN
jgi:Tfp pilus assembly protein PilZ